MASRLRELADSRAFAAALVGGALVYALSLVDLGWIPHDDGMLAQAAGRVLDGQLPHRDFDDPYTGGQALGHALAFALLGERLLTLRLVLFAALAAATPAAYRIARRFAGRGAAALVTALGVAWGVPAHPLAMPSWYNLFLAVWGLAALLRFQDTRRRRWLLAAGACAGLSVVVKVVGLYLLAAMLLYLVFLEQEEGTAARDGRGGAADGAVGGQAAHRALVSGGLVAFLGALAAVLAPAAAPSTAVWLFLPPATLGALLLHREWTRRPVRPGRARTRTLVERGLPVLAGAAAPVALLLVPYLATGSVGALVEGALVAPGRRLDTFLRLPPPAWSALPLAAVAALVAVAARGRRADAAVAAALAVPLAVVALGAGGEPALYRGGWWLLHPLVPVVVVVGVVRLAGGGRRGRAEDAGAAPSPAPDDAARFLLLAGAALVALVGYPTYLPHYVFYSAPLAALAALAVAAPLARAPRATLAVLVAFHLVFAVRWIHRAEIWRMGDRFNAHPPAARLDLPRGGLRVTPEEAATYERLVAALEQVGAGPWLWAGPDAPEVYFLSGLANPTRTFYDFLDPDFYADRAGRVARLEAVLERHDVRAVVVKRTPTLVSPPVSGALRDMLVARYPRAAEIGPFVVMVRGEGR